MQYKIQPWKHQLAAIEKARRFDEFALFFEVGTGKTATLINILRERFLKEGRIMRTMIVCPIIVVENWRREWLMHSYIKPSDVVCLLGIGEYKYPLFEANLDKDRVFIANYECFQSERFVKAFKGYKFEVLACDESHYIKNYKAKRTKVLTDLAKSVKHKYILTGTPILNTPMDIYSQFKFLDNGKTFGDNFFVFRSNFFYDANARVSRKIGGFPKWIPKSTTAAEMQKLVEIKSARAKKSECLDLPPLLRQVQYADLSGEQQAAYIQMKQDFISYIGGAACVAQLALTKALRMMQIVTGFATVQDPYNPGQTANVKFPLVPRLDALKQILFHLPEGEKCIIWACWKENIIDIAATLTQYKYDFVQITGDTKTSDKQKNVDRFNTDKKCTVMLASQAACGTGVNLTAASYSIYYSRNFSLEQDLQSEARNYRGGSEVHKKITRIDIVAHKTIDELIVKKLHEKQAMGEAIIGEIKEALQDGMGGR